MKNLCYKVIRKHINRWDPMYLLILGAPNDEYESEIEVIVEAVLQSKDEIEIAEAIKDTFERSFDTELNSEACIKVAKLIWKDLYE